MRKELQATLKPCSSGKQAATRQLAGQLNADKAARSWALLKNNLAQGVFSATITAI